MRHCPPGQVLDTGIRRINLGGKAMTNYLKELVSYRWALTVDRGPLTIC